MTNQTRKELLNSPDQFMTATATTVNWIKNNRKTFGAGLAAAVLIIGGAGFYHYWNQDRQHAAMNAVYAAAEKPEALQAVVTDYPGTKGAAVARLRLASQAFAAGDYKKARSEAEGFSAKWNSKDAVYWQARQLAAACLLAEGDHAGAAAAFGECADKGPAEMRDQALFLQTIALAKQGKTAAAQKISSQIKGDYQTLSRSYGS
jgi:tetratricopeptide (TPR) repeat protein